MSGRRFLWRWTLRMLRREWRQHLVIAAFLCAGVAVSVGAALGAYHMVEPPESQFGAGDFAASASNPDALERSLIQQGVDFSRIDSGTVRRDASTERATIKALDPTSPTAAPLFSLREGRWPNSSDELAITDAALTGVDHVDASVVLGDRAFTVVGLVENPTALDDEFVVISELDSFGSTVMFTTEFLIAGTPDAIDLTAGGLVGVSSSSGPPARTAATLVVNVISAFGMLEVGLLSGSAFAVMARRRSQQFGVLVAAGAAPSAIRTTATMTGFVIGVVGVALGSTIAIAAILALLGTIESAVGHRVTFEPSALAIVPSAVVGIVVATVSSRRPAIALSRRSVVELLSSQRPVREPVGRLAVVGLGSSVLGGVLLVAGFSRLDMTMALIGTVLAPIGLLLVAPLAVSSMGLIAQRLPLAERIAGRSLARYNRRSAAVVAALALALSLSVGVAVVTSSIEARATTAGPNLDETDFVVWATGADGHAPRTPVAIDRRGLDATVDVVRELLPTADMAPIQVATPVGATAEEFEDGVAEVPIVAALSPLDAECTFCDLDSYGFRDELGVERVYEARAAWIGSEELLGLLDIDSEWTESDAMAVVREPGLEVAWYEGLLAPTESVVVAPQWPQNTSVPSVLYSGALVDDSRFEVSTVGWFATVDESISVELADRLRDAVTGDVAIEFHEPVQPRTTIRWAALAIAVIVGLGLTIAAVGLLSAEMADDIAVLVSLGSPPAVARRTSAGVAAMLSLLGAAIALLIGYVPLLPMVVSKADNFPFVVPWAALGVVIVVFPLLAAALGWMLSRSASRRVHLRQSI